MANGQSSQPDRGISPFLAAGAEVGPYRVESFIERGGMAFVYEATDLRLGRHVALKVLAPELAQDPDFRQRFLRESRFAASLDHPNIVPIYGAGEAGELLYIAMRYVPGGDLASVLAKEGRLELKRALAILRPVADALDTAHDAGLVHRDVKPGNILISAQSGRDGHEHVYLSDFGLTKRASSLSKITASGLFVGTMAYIAPEQIQGAPLDARTDLYALGCVTYECLTGSAPFVRDDQAALLWAHLSEKPPPVSGYRSELSGADEVLATALAKDPNDRYQSGDQFLTALTDALQPRPAGGSQAPTAIRATPQGVAAVDTSPRPRPVGRTPLSQPLSQPASPSSPPRAPTVQRQAAVSVPPVPTPVDPRPAPPRRLGARREPRSLARLTAFVAALILAAGAATWFMVLRPGDAAMAADLTLPFDSEQYDNGVVVSRSWSLSREGDALHGELIMVGGSPGATYDEVIPKSLAATAAQVRSTPSPLEIIKSDPVLRFRAPTEEGSQLVVTYDIDVVRGPANMERLKSWARNQKQAHEAYIAETQAPAPVTLTSLNVNPAKLSISPDQQPHRLSLSGTDSAGLPVESAALEDAAWASTDEKVASVDTEGVVRAHARGAVSITAQLGALSAEAVILVTEATTAGNAPSHRLPDGRVVRPGSGGGPTVASSAASPSPSPSPSPPPSPSPSPPPSPSSTPTPSPSGSPTPTESTTDPTPTESTTDPTPTDPPTTDPTPTDPPTTDPTSSSAPPTDTGTDGSGTDGEGESGTAGSGSAGPSGGSSPQP